MGKRTLHTPRRHHRRILSGWSGGTPIGLCLALSLLIAGLTQPVRMWASDAYLRAQPADTSSPRTTLKSFIDACNEVSEVIKRQRHFDRAEPKYRPLMARIIDCIDASELPEYERYENAGEVAACLKEIIDRVEVPPYDKIPDSEAIAAAGGLETNPRYRIPGTRITIARVEEGPRRHEYLFSPGTVGRAVEYYEDLKSLPYRTTGPRVSDGLYQWYVSAPGSPAIGAVVDRLPDWFRNQFFGQAVWKWCGLLVIACLALVLMVACYRGYARLRRRFHSDTPVLYCLTMLLPIVAAVTPLGVRFIAFEYLTMRGNLFYVLSFTTSVIAVLASLVVVGGTCSRVAEFIIASPQINPRGLNAQLIRIASKLLSLLGIVVVPLEGGHYLGIPITTLLASAGIGGLALALAAQDTLKTL